MSKNPTRQVCNIYANKAKVSIHGSCLQQFPLGTLDSVSGDWRVRWALRTGMVCTLQNRIMNNNDR